MSGPAERDPDDTLPADPSELGDSAGASHVELVRGDLVARCVVLATQGTGAMGVVYAAYDPELDRKVAVKLLRSRTDASSPARQRVQREAQALAQVHHPNVVTIHDVGTHADRLWLAMEFVDGRTLGSWLAERPRDWREVLALAISIARGLAAAHDAGLVHRDVKPDNVMVAADGRVVVTDFGLALPARGEGIDTDASGSRPRLTELGRVAGTPAFMSPEQMLGDEVGAASDQFSFGVVLWSALFGARPFAGHNLLELVGAVQSGTLSEPPRTSSVPLALRKVVTRGLMPRPSDRHPSMHAMIDAMQRQLGRRTPASYELATGRIDAWTAAWSEARREACEQATASGRPDDDEHARARACFDERTDELAGMVELIREADAAVVRSMGGTVAGLSPIAACGDTAALARAFADVDPARRSEAAALRSELLRARNLLSAEHFAAARMRLEPVLAAAAAAGFERLLAEATLTEGRISERAGELVGYRMGAIDRGKLWGEVADALVQRLGENEQLRGANLHNNLGLITKAPASLDESREHFLHAVEARATLFGVEHPSYAAVLDNLAGVEASAGNLDRALELRRQALAIMERAFGPDHPDVALAIAHTAEILSMLRDDDEALELLERALVSQLAAFGRAHVEVAKTLVRIGGVQHDRGDLQAAEASFEHALTPMASCRWRSSRRAGHAPRIRTRRAAARATSSTCSARRSASSRSSSQAYARPRRSRRRPPAAGRVARSHLHPSRRCGQRLGIANVDERRARVGDLDRSTRPRLGASVEP